MASVVSVLPQWPPGRFNAAEPEGSGVVVLDGRHVVTVLHVVAVALSVRVRTADGRLLPATLAGRDRATDLALLRIEEELAPLPFAGPAQIGQRVCALANAFGQDLSVTCGVVSAVHRAGTGFNPIEDFVQTDAAVNPGASGGALVDGEGRLVGVLSAIFAKRSDANIGVNFAVSAALAEKVVRALRAEGGVRWLSSGLRLEGVPDKGGLGRLAARVVSVREGSPAALAGFAPGDRIHRAGGRRVRKPADFVSVMALARRGKALPVEIVREGAEMRIMLKLPAE